MRNEAVPPTRRDDGYETHPAWGMISAARWQGGSNVLFDSDIVHNETIVITIEHAERKRDIGRDFIMGRKHVVEVQMSMAQWASFVSSMNTTGVPCTIRYEMTADGYVRQPDIVEAPRLADSIRYNNEAAHRAFDDIKTALSEYETAVAGGVGKRRQAELLHALRCRIDNAVPNVAYAGKTLVEHAENTVQLARADVEAMVARHADRVAELGYNPNPVALPELEVGES